MQRARLRHYVTFDWPRAESASSRMSLQAVSYCLSYKITPEIRHCNVLT